MKELLKVGDPVAWRGCWGSQSTAPAVVQHIELNCVDKDGTPVEEVPWDQVDSSTVVDLTNGHWAYGNQIGPLKEVEYAEDKMDRVALYAPRRVRLLS